MTSRNCRPTVLRLHLHHPSLHSPLPQLEVAQYVSAVKVEHRLKHVDEAGPLVG